MKNIFKKIFINKFKSIFFMLQNSNSNFLEIKNICFSIKKNCALGRKNSIIFSRPDLVITPNLLKNGQWDNFIIKFITKYKKKKLNYSFIDLGANIGLITRQLILKKSKILNFHCIEPEKNNFFLLKKNLQDFKKEKIFLYNIALKSNDKNLKKIYINEENFGDFSLIRPANATKFTDIKSVNINTFLKKIINQNNIKNIIYKSDIQGMDEMVALSINEEIYDKIKIMILEIENLKYLKKNLKKFLILITKFSIMYDENNTKLNLNMIIEKIKTNKSFNLLLAKI